MTKELKTHVRNASIFLLGVIATIIITKLSDKIIPNEPVIVKQYTDTLKIVHDYEIPKRLNSDSDKKELEKKIKNLELLNSYDKQIKERIAINQSNDVITPNLILTQKVRNSEEKGYSQGSSSSYFESDCPSLDTKYLDIFINFLNPEIINEIAFLRINIYKFDSVNSSESRSYILEDFYEVKKKNNLIRITNDFSKGKYEILYGFMFKNDLNKKYPTFYMKKCIVIK
jgi:hypothetical protein